MTVVKSVNKWLATNFGKHDDGRPFYRIVWSDSQLEKRIGHYSEWYGDIFLRNNYGMRETPKYPYLKERWVFEKLIFHPGGVPEIVGSENGTYEPIFVFMDKAGNYLPVEHRAVALIMHSLHNPKKSTPGDIEDEQARKEAAEVQHYLDVFENDNPYIAGMLHDKSAIVVP